MSNKKKFSVKERIKSFVYAFNGLKNFFITQHNAWIHFLAMILVIFAGFIFNINFHEWCLLAIAIGMVFISEIFNTAIEFLTDIISPNYNEKAGKVKDIAAAGVLVSSLIAIVIGLLIFIPKLLSV